MSPPDFQLATIVVEPHARKAVAAAYGLPSGVVPVLAALAFKRNQGDLARPGEIYEANIGAKTLVRRYISLLIKARLVERYKPFAVTFIRLTVTGLMAIGQYERKLREGVVNFAHIKPKRVLIH